MTVSRALRFSEVSAATKMSLEFSAFQNVPVSAVRTFIAVWKSTSSKRSFARFGPEARDRK